MKVPRELIDAGLRSGGGSNNQFEFMDLALEAVLPMVRERLLSDAVADKAHSRASMADPQLRPVNRAVIDAALEAAFYAAFPKDES